MPGDRAHYNGCRFVRGGTDGHYESYFLRANHPTRPLAFWIRYTIFSPRRAKGPHDNAGELWAIFFDGEKQKITATKEVVPFEDCSFTGHGLDARIGPCTLDDSSLQGSARGQGHELSWDLTYEGDGEPLLLLPEAFYERSFPKAKALVGAPNVTYRGHLVVDGERVEIEGWPGSQNHNWGSRHTDEYAWGQVAGFDDAPDAFFECSTARVKVGPVFTPWMTLLVLRLGDEELRLNSLSRAVRAHGRFEFFRWSFESQEKGVRLFGEISAPPWAFIALPYDNPPGGRKTCLNSKIARCELTVHRPGHAPRHLVSENRAAFEILTDATDHGVDLLPAPPVGEALPRLAAEGRRTEDALGSPLSGAT